MRFSDTAIYVATLLNGLPWNFTGIKTKDYNKTYNSSLTAEHIKINYLLLAISKFKSVYFRSKRWLGKNWSGSPLYI